MRTAWRTLQGRGADLVPDLPRRAVRPDQLRKRRLERGIAPHQRVVLGVGNLRRVLGVIEPVMMRDRPREPHQFVGGFGFGDVVDWH